MLRILPRLYTTEAIVTRSSKRRELFDKELNEQLQSNHRRLEKIEVACEHLSQGLTLTMNKNISTPLDCAKHIQEYLVTKSVLALVNDKPYGMNRVLTDNCKLQFLDFRSDNCSIVNLAFWRSCSFLTNWVLETCFHDDFQVNLCSFPAPNINSGSFVCDVQILYKGSTDFDPDLIRKVNLKSISHSARKLIFENNNFIPLLVNQHMAELILSDAPLKLRQIPMIAQSWPEQSHNEGKIPLYRVGDHVDICRGPLISSTMHIGRFKMTAAYPIETDDYGRLFRFQGIAIPLQLPTHSTTFDILAKRAETPNKYARLPELKSRTDRVAVPASVTMP